MGRRGGFGVGQQGFHPRARGAISQENGGHGYGPFALTGEEMTAQYFVPSFSIRRHIHESEMPKWTGIQKQIGSILGRHYDVMTPHELAIKSIEQKTMIEKVRESGVQPTASEMRAAAHNIRDELSTALEAVPEPLEVGLGRLAIFGRHHNKIGFEIDGWKGWKARYSLLTQAGELTAPGALVLENHIAVGGIASALPEATPWDRPEALSIDRHMEEPAQLRLLA
jgi:hypothetical protein